MIELKHLLLTAPDNQLDKSIFPLIEHWDEQPTSIQILEVLDKCIHGSLGSDFIVKVLQIVYEEKLLLENKKHEDNIPLATWRNG